MARLQRMRHIVDGRDFELVHIVDECHHGAEFTICGNAIPDSTIEHDETEAIGDYFIGSIRKCTCPICSKHLAYYKALR